MIDPDYLAAPLADGTVLISEDEYQLIKALDDEGTIKSKQHRDMLVNIIRENSSV
jgi:hypothetical protein